MGIPEDGGKKTTPKSTDMDTTRKKKKRNAEKNQE